MASNNDAHRLPRESVLPDPETKARMDCAKCGAEFPRNEVESVRKGVLACPECGSRMVRSVVNRG